MFHRGIAIFAVGKPDGNPDGWLGWGVFRPVMPGRSTSIDLGGDPNSIPVEVEFNPARYIMIPWEGVIILAARQERLGVRLFEAVEFRRECGAALCLVELRQAALDAATENGTARARPHG